MAINQVTTSTKFSTWKDITNAIIAAIGDNASLNTDAKTSLVAAVNEVDTAIGNLTTLSTSTKTSLVAAVNEVLSNLGTISSLSTTAKTSLVAAVNELVSKRGDLSALATTEKSYIVGAINEVVAKLGDLTSLSTTEKNSLVGAVNELHGQIGDLTSLSTTEKNSLVGAVNEVQGVAATAMTFSDMQYTNLESNGGRFASDALTSITVATYSNANTVLQANNSAVFAAGENFVNDNSNYGGAGAALGTDISTLMNALSTKASRSELRYGYEFYILNATAGAGVNDGYAHPTTLQTYYPIAASGDVLLGRIGAKVTWMGWVRVKTVADAATYTGIVVGNDSVATYIDGELQAEPKVLQTSDGWVHVRQTFTLTKEFESIFPGIYANNGDVVQVALSARFTGDVDIGLHAGLV